MPRRRLSSRPRPEDRARQRPACARNVRHATTRHPRQARGRVSARWTDWEALRDAAHHIKDHTLRYLDCLSRAVRGALHAGRRPRPLGARCRRGEPASIIDIIRSARPRREIIKVKTMTSGRDAAERRARGRRHRCRYETDLADLIIQLGVDRPSHIVVPALHRNRTEIRDIFRRTMQLEELDRSAAGPGSRRRGSSCGRSSCACQVGFERRQLRRRRHRVGLRRRNRKATGGCASRCRACSITLVGHREDRPGVSRPRSLPAAAAARSATGERMNPYNSI